MASTIQVDVIKDIGGNTIISSNGSGTFTSNLPASGATLTGSTNNQVVTVTGANAITGETNLTYNGTILGVGASADLGVGLHVKTADSGASVDSNGDELVIENSGNTGMTILSGTGSSGGIYFGDSGNNNIGYIEYGHNTNQLSIATGGTANSLVIDSTGAVTKPLQPGFSATKSTSAQAVNANYVSVNFNNEIWDNNADWNGSTTFTAPVTGKYMFTGAMRINSILAQGGSVFGRINTSNRPYVFGNITDADDVFNATVAAYQFQGAVVADMDANDTATLDFFSNFATTIAADAERVWFQGYLLG